MPSDSGTVEVALFPIPDAVAFPGTHFPLHVFEPRYRQLVHDCVSEDRMVAVSHVLKTIHKPGKHQSPEQALRSNQATYKPQRVFSAGLCEILETTSDGRLIASIRVSLRLSLVEELQSLPYLIVSCMPLHDEPPQSSFKELRVTQNLINERLIALAGPSELARELNDPAWTALDPSEFSFKVFQHLRFDADAMQYILEATSADTRLNLIWDLLRRV